MAGNNCKSDYKMVFCTHNHMKVCYTLADYKLGDDR